MKRTDEHHSTRLAGSIFDVQATGKFFKDPYNTISNSTNARRCKIYIMKNKSMRMKRR
jgi:hypothetical protein